MSDRLDVWLHLALLLVGLVTVWQTRRARLRTTGEITASVRQACADVGLPLEQMAPGFDLARTGKLYDVLALASARLGKDHELRTVADVCDWLHMAPGARR